MSEGLRLALVAYQQGKLDEALRLADKHSGKAGAMEGKLQALKGNILFKLGRKSAAADAFIHAARLTPAEAAAFMKLGVTLYLQDGAVHKVVEHAAQAVKLNSGDSDFAYQAARTFYGNGLRGDPTPLFAYLDQNNDRHLALIINYFRLQGDLKNLQGEMKALCNARPDNAFLRSCYYTVARENGDFAAMEEQERLMQTTEGEALLPYEAAFARLLWCEDETLLAVPSTDSSAAACEPRAAFRRAFSSPGEKIRIGYLSNDFTEHATMTLFREALSAHDRSKFEITLFSYAERQAEAKRTNWPDHLKREIIEISDLNDEEAARLISERQVDILVDLKGHTMGARTGITNRSDAPLKVTYLGFPGSVYGMDLDYHITDRIVTPDSSKPYFAEKLCRLPDSYQANNSATRPLPRPMTRAEVGLPEGVTVFSSFNAERKITPRTVRLWAAILREVKDAVLWIMCQSADFRASLAARFAAEGIAADRIIYCGHKPYGEHISRVALADLGLDTFPYNGHTTTSDMLWAGLPVITVHGTAFQSRVSVSLLSALGMEELVLKSDEEFVREGIRLGRDHEALGDIRARVEKARKTAPLFDTEKFTRSVERGYELMAERARNGLPPDHLDVE